MSGEYALRLMKVELRDKKHEVEEYEKIPDKDTARTVTKLKHQIWDLEFAIELLEEYQD
ncbi:hypothetical protein [Paenibacillus lautus]|uniref:hypothetical protein n=1 Tax=Paenibacillus lautus TaxID=1401 RepID=UPI001C7CCF55|nr:hypothetical protein [Paenibacillus lautus]MBX4152374.1 hypothetical protein [Paenibacillus lautus]